MNQEALIQLLVQATEEGELNAISFSKAIEYLSGGKKVLPFDENKAECQALLEALTTAARNIKQEINSIQFGVARRVNELGNDMEDYVIKHLNLLGPGMKAQKPANKKGKVKNAGYPDVEFTMGNVHCYVECKTFQEKTKDSSFRTFYFQPARKDEFKVTKDAYHMLVAFHLEEGAAHAVQVKGFHILSLDHLLVHLKPEFNASNRDLYGGIHTVYTE